MFNTVKWFHYLLLIIRFLKDFGTLSLIFNFVLLRETLSIFLYMFAMALIFCFISTSHWRKKKKKHFAAAVITGLLPMNKRNHHKKKKKYRLLSVWLSCWSFGYKLDLEFRHHLLHTCYRLLDKKVPKPKDSEVQWYFSQPPRQPTFIPHGNINNINVPEFTVHDRFLLPAGPTSTRLVAAMLKTIQPATHNINSCLNMWLAGGFKIPFMFLYPVTLLD